LGADKLVAGIAQPIERIMAKHINEILQNNSHQMVENLVTQETDHLLSMTMSELANGHQDQLKQIKGSILNAYRVIITEHLPRMLQDIDISTIIEQRINEMDMMEAEQLIHDIAKKELKAIVWFGALLGFLIGCLNCFLL